MRALWCLLCVSGLLCAADALLPVFQKAVAALSSGDYAAAEAGFQQVLKASPNHVGALGNLGVVYSRTSRPDKAIATYQRALRIVPQDRGLMLNLGLVYVKQESFTDALPLFERLVAAHPSNLQARELLATSQLNTGRVAAAIQSLEGLRKEDPNSAFVLYMLGIAYLKHKEPDKARTALDELVATTPPAQTNFMLGKVYYESARFEDAADSYRAVLAADGNHAGAHRELGKVLVSQRDPAAEKEFAAALNQDPNDSEALYFLGGFLMQQDRLQEAVAPLERARELNPGFWGTYFYLGKMKFQTDHPREAVPLLQKAAELNPGETAVYYQLGRARSACGREAEARRAMERVREIKSRELDKAIEAVQVQKK
jgi:tetratricopeptide (TPR) repeat protein